MTNAQPSIFVSETFRKNAAFDLTTTLEMAFCQEGGRIGLLPDRPRVRDGFPGGDLDSNLDLLLNADFEGTLVLDLALAWG